MKAVWQDVAVGRGDFGIAKGRVEAAVLDRLVHEYHHCKYQNLERCDDLPRLKGKHLYDEALVHACPRVPGAVFGVSPRTFQPIMKPRAPPFLTAFAHALRKENMEWIREAVNVPLTGDSNTDQVIKLLQELVKDELVFADLAVQVHRGAAVPLEEVSWHVDGPNSILHAALSIAGERRVHNVVNCNGEARHSCDAQLPGDLYVATPFSAVHGVEFPELLECASVSVQMRFHVSDYTALKTTGISFAHIMNHVARSVSNNQLRVPILESIVESGNSLGLSLCSSSIPSLVIGSRSGVPAVIPVSEKDIPMVARSIRSARTHVVGLGHIWVVGPERVRERITSELENEESWTFVGEDTIVEGLTVAWVQEHGLNSWHFQQLLKLACAYSTTLCDSRFMFILDSDLCWLRKVPLFAPSGVPVLFPARWRTGRDTPVLPAMHRVVTSLFGFECDTSICFISHNQVIDRSRLRELLVRSLDHNGSISEQPPPFMEIAKSIIAKAEEEYSTFHQSSFFHLSEYEAYGQFMWKFYRNEVSLPPGKHHYFHDTSPRFPIERVCDAVSKWTPPVYYAAFHSHWRLPETEIDTDELVRLLYEDVSNELQHADAMLRVIRDSGVEDKCGRLTQSFYSGFSAALAPLYDAKDAVQRVQSHCPSGCTATELTKMAAWRLFLSLPLSKTPSHGCCHAMLVSTVEGDTVVGAEGDTVLVSSKSSRLLQEAQDSLRLGKLKYVVADFSTTWKVYMLLQRGESTQCIFR